MAIYSYDQIKDLWILYGGNPMAAPIAAAIAMAESGGDSNNINTRNSNGSIDRGLFQINSIHGAQSTFDLATNVRAAIQISGNGSNWQPWTVFKTGAYKKYLDGTVTQGKSEIKIEDQPAASPFDFLKPIAELASTVMGASTWIGNPHNIIRIWQVGSGLGLILVGLVILNRGVIEDVGKTVATVTKGVAAA